MPMIDVVVVVLVVIVAVVVIVDDWLKSEVRVMLSLMTKTSIWRKKK